MKKRILSVVLCIALAVGVIAPASVAANNDNENVTVSATTDETIKINKVEDYVEPDYNGILELTAGEFDIKRDYSQFCKIQVKNTSDKAVEYYLAVVNPYDDIYMNFVRSGSVDEPILINSGETQEIQLDIFAQNAIGTEYKIPVYACVIGDEYDVEAKATVILKCPAVAVNFTLDETGENVNSLAKTFVLENTGVALTDVEVYANSELSDYLSFSPIISNYSMAKNEKVEFKVRPDLTKMKNNNVTKLEGKIVVSSGGSSQEFEVSFDTKGQEIVSMTMGELAALQNGEKLDSLSTNATGNAALCYEYKNSQCTNAGKTKNDFYLDDWDILGSNALSDSDFEMYVTSRMYAGSGSEYVHIKDTNYTYILNGVNVGSSYSSGVTDLAIAKIPTDNLKFGARNTLICDYDTNPGNHFVTANTQITLVIPGDTPVSYIGSPVGLEDVRSLPDLAIYSENIFPESDRVYLGEKTKISFNVYNRGSETGTFDISVSDGTNVIFEEKDCSLDAFSGDTVTFDWTPENKTNNITVTLSNKDSSIVERDTANNSATKAIVVDERKVPSILSVTDVGVKYGDSYTLSVDVKDASEVSDVVFYIDDNRVSGEMKKTTISGGTRYYISTNTQYSSGTHTIKAVVEYSETADTTKTIEGTAQLSVAEKDWKVPTVSIDVPELNTYGTALNVYTYIDNGEDVKNVKIVVDDVATFIATKEYSYTYSCYLGALDVGEHKVKAIVTYVTNENGDTAEIISDTTIIKVLSEAESSLRFSVPKEFANNMKVKICRYNYDYTYEAVCQKVEDTSSYVTYKINLTSDMINNRDIYSLYVVSDNALLYSSFAESSVVFEKDKCKKLSFVTGDSIDLEKLTWQKFNDKSSSVYSYSVGDEYYCTPGKYALQLDYILFNSAYQSKALDIDLTTEDQVVDLTADIKKFDFVFEENNHATIKQAIVISEDEYGSRYSFEGYSQKDDKTGVYSLLIANSELAKKIDSGSKLYLYVLTEDAVYFEEIVSFDEPVKLNKSELRKVTVNVEDSKTMSISYMAISGTQFDIDVSGNEIYLPQGEYVFYVACMYSNDKAIYKSFEVIVADVDQVFVIENTFAKIMFNWSKAYNSVAETMLYGENSTYGMIENGGFILAEKGEYEATMSLSRNTDSYYISTTLDCSEGDCSLDIGNKFAGKITTDFADEYNGNNSVRLLLDDLVDENGNELQSFDCYNYEDKLGGYVTLTNVNDDNDVIKIYVSVYTLSDNSAITFSLPNVTGEYKISVELRTNNEKEDTEQLLPEFITVCYDGSETIYSCGKLPEIYLGSGSTEGTISWNSTELKVGTHEYSWTFVPHDTEKYKSVTGSVELTVLDEHCWSEWSSDGNASFFCEGTKTRTCLVCGESENVVDENSAGYHAYLCGGERSWITATVLTAIGTTITWLVIHLNFWWIIGL